MGTGLSNAPENCRALELVRIDVNIRPLDDFATVGILLGTRGYIIVSAMLNSINKR